MSEFTEARAALARTIRAVFPDARPVPRWAGVEAWGAPRPVGAIVDGSTGTYDPKLIVIGIADRKSGPTIYFLDPGDYFALDTHRALLAEAGFKLGRGCIMHTKKAPLPVAPLETLFRRVKERDAALAVGTKPAKAPAPAARAAKKGAKPRATRARAKDAAKEAAGAAAVDAYLADLPPGQGRALARLRRQVLAAAPGATEKMSYGMPTFALEGNLVHMAAFRDHLSFFPGSSGVTLLLERELDGFETAKGTIRFTPGHPIPAALVQRIVKMRVEENMALASTRGRKPKAKAKAAAKSPAPKAARKRARS